MISDIDEKISDRDGISSRHGMISSIDGMNLAEME